MADKGNHKVSIDEALERAMEDVEQARTGRSLDGRDAYTIEFRAFCLQVADRCLHVAEVLQAEREWEHNEIERIAQSAKEDES